MKKVFYKISRWFDLNLGWFFVNPNKQDAWYEYLNKKYNKK
jgi:hypothetical protein